MYEVRLHGRGGQGTVTAAELLSVAAFEDGLSAQAFPSFGSERMGAPVEAYCRIATGAIRTREPVLEPDALIILDPTLVHHVDLFSGIRPGGCVLMNTVGSFDELGLGALVARLAHDRLVTVPATELARQHLGRPTPNSALLGGFAALTGLVSLEAVAGAFRRRFPGAVGEANASAAAAAFAHVAREREELAHASPA
jgi:pyruvate ferredoxin oxidoreductase gamma subunit